MNARTQSNQDSNLFTKVFKDDDEQQYTEEGMTFEEMFEKSVEDTPSTEGEILLGKVVSVGEERVLVDVGLKAEGEVSLQEFKTATGEIDIKEGDEIHVYLEKAENKNGLLQLSKERADIMRAWGEIAEACERGDILEGTVLQVVKGGLQVDIGVKAFLPGSQVDVRPIKNLEQFVGQSLKFKVIKFNQRRGNIVLSRRAVVELERDSLKDSTLKELKVGAIVVGAVKNITDYGAFIDLGGLDGLLHITDMSWGRIKHPSEVLTVGQDINVRVLKFDQEKERVSLGLKQTLPDPWEDVQSRFMVGQRINGKVVNLTDYGAFIEIEPGIEGLIHVSEMSWTQRVKDPRKLLDMDEEMESVILDIDLESRRMSLGLKQISANPWDSLEHKYPPGTRVKGSIKNITDFGVFVEIEEGIDGLVHVSDLSWDEKITHPSEAYEKSQEVEAIVLSIDKDNERVSLSIKALSGDPWAEKTTSFKVGEVVDGKVTKLANFGAFVEIAEGLEGMVHISEISEERIMHPEAVVKVGDEVKAMVTNIDTKERKISLSMKAILRQEEEENISAYKKSTESSSRSSFADTLDPAIAEKLGLIGKKKEED